MMGESWEEDDKAAKMGGKTIYSGDGCWAVVTIVEQNGGKKYTMEW